MKSTQELKEAGFTESGKSRYSATLAGYSEALFSKAVNYGEVDKAPDIPREVTHDHVRAAAHSIAASYGSPQRSKLAVFLQILEYVFTAAAGVGGGNLKESWGVPVFVLGVALAVVCFVVRSLKEKKL